MAEGGSLTICCNLAIAIPIFYLVYYMVASFLSGAFKIDTFNGKTPFDFDNCCSGTDAKLGEEKIRIHDLWYGPSKQVTVLSLVLTYVISTAVYLIFIRRRVWDYAVTISVIHFGMSCAVMWKFPSNWEWWLAFGSSILFMVLFGEIAIRCCLKDTSVAPQRNSVT